MKIGAEQDLSPHNSLDNRASKEEQKKHHQTLALPSKTMKDDRCTTR